jgi:hypothetical protein
MCALRCDLINYVREPIGIGERPPARLLRQYLRIVLIVVAILALASVRFAIGAYASLWVVLSRIRGIIRCPARIHGIECRSHCPKHRVRLLEFIVECRIACYPSGQKRAWRLLCEPDDVLPPRKSLKKSRQPLQIGKRAKLPIDGARLIDLREESCHRWDHRLGILLGLRLEHHRVFHLDVLLVAERRRQHRRVVVEPLNKVQRLPHGEDS